MLPPVQVDPSELRFLALRFLDDGSCPEAVRALADSLHMRGRLPQRAEIQGEHACVFSIHGRLACVQRVYMRVYLLKRLACNV